MVLAMGSISRRRRYPPGPAKGLYPGYTVVVTRGRKARRGLPKPSPIRPPMRRRRSQIRWVRAFRISSPGDMSLHWANPLSAR